MIEGLSSKRYEPPSINLDDKNNSHSLIVEMVGKDKLVLEVGTSTGYLSKILKDKGNQVLGIEIDPEAAKIAKQYCEPMIIGNIETIELDTYIEDSSLDVIILGDVLEHLVFPRIVLKKVKKYLKPSGYLVVSLPNICHGDVLINLLNGDFRYTPWGLLDETHLRFYGRENIIKELNDCGYFIVDLRTVRITLGSTEQNPNLNGMPSDIVKFIKQLPGSDVYQFVLQAIPCENPPSMTALETTSNHLSQDIIREPLEALKNENTMLMSWLQEERSQINALQLELRNLSSDFKNLSEAYKLEKAFWEHELHKNTSYITTLEQEIAEMRNSIMWQIAMKYNNCVVERACPQGTHRRQWYDLGIEGCRILITNGPGEVIQKFKEKMQNRKEIKMVRGDKRSDIDIYKNYINDLFLRSSAKSNEYIPFALNNINLTEDDVKLIAFYLPQYHPIPENDEWWGKGFTEWTNVSKAVPQFIGHYQPHLPDELGFYDLRLIEVQKRQIELAKNYGIYGFCFHYYWFNGKRLLEKPLHQFLKNTELNFPFCLCWANENWTRRWDGLENEVLIAQNHSPENDISFIKDLAPFLRDPRYIRIDNKPILIIYHTLLLPNINKTVETWRTYCKELGIGDLYLIAAQTFGFKDPRNCGFDAAVEFPPHANPGCECITNKMNTVNPNFEGRIYNYDGFVKNKQYLEKVPYKLFKTVTPGWDNTARKPNNPSIFYGSNPSNYKEWLWNIAKWTVENNSVEERFIFVNAWNEWAEGAHLEPDRKYGYGYLQSTLEVIQQCRKRVV